ncbi:hypothetical protein QLX08_000685 [Tetragonisca angustula]|uniref:Uncharacterized protein n=1 Tax=Tetragonisca angustula TaxID=166442 RepID=A0AAW1AI83_9HYME
MIANVPKSKHTDGEVPIKRLITSEVEYCQEPCSQMEECLTRDVAVESRVETDDAQVTADIYSTTDPSFETDEETEAPKPGTVVPEYYGDQRAILRVYRCKGVNVTESDFPESRWRINIFSVGKDQSRSRKKGMGDDVRAYCLAAIGSCIPCINALGMKITGPGPGPVCHKNCPNLVISECSQTVHEPTRKGKRGLDTTLATVQEVEKEDDELRDTGKKRVPIGKVQIVDVKSAVRLDRVETQDVCVGPADSLPVDKATCTCEEKRDIFDAGTIIFDRLTTWLDRPRKRDCRDRFLRYSGIQPLVSHCMVQCDINHCESFTNRWLDGGSRCCRVASSRWQEPSEFWPTTDCWSRRNSGLFEDAAHQLGRINSLYRYSIAGGSPQKYAQYRNCVRNRYNYDRYCPYDSGNSSWNASRYCCPPANQVFCYTTANYCRSYNSWY